ncbi:MAG TPA: DDE transposase [Candidatus Atribacteria bacterium]|nr:DDE transposase [Candidatus Atribacteria bacterium]
MSFHLNNAQQMAINDSLLSLTERERKYLNNSWAETFSKKIFPFIKEDRFSILYSDNPASRPNNPVNVYFGLLILREIFNQSDEEALNSLMFDIRYQHALHTTSFQEQPVSKNSLTNFRAAVYRYNQEHGIDLIQQEIEAQAKSFSKLLKIDGKTVRMDSLMISSSCKKLSRLEIIYSTVARLIKVIDKNTTLPEYFKPYLEESHYNDTIYRARDKDLNTRIKKVLKDGVRLYSLYRKDKEIRKTKEFKLLARMLKEQKGKSSKHISPNSLQNPTDPDATYRKKGKKKHIGYTANIVEKFDDNNRMIEGYDLQKNTYSDQKFAEDTIKRLDKGTTALVDGAYYSEDIDKKAKDKGIKMVPTNLVGGGKNNNGDKFEIDEKKHLVKRCPSGYKPINSKFKEGSYRAHFNKKHCNDCPLRKDCPVIEQKKSYFLKVSEKTLHRCRLITKMGTSEYQELAKKRAGIEGIPSVLRRRYKIDHLPVRGEVRSKVYLGFKISAINCKRLIKGLMNRPKEGLPALLFNHLLSLFSFQRTYRVKFAA